MPTRKLDPDFKRRYLANALIFGVPFLAAWAGGFYFDDERWQLGSALTAGAIALVGLVRQERMFRRYRCPSCGERLPQSPCETNQPIEFFCPRCDVIWDSGMARGEPAGG